MQSLPVATCLGVKSVDTQNQSVRFGGSRMGLVFALPHCCLRRILHHQRSNSEVLAWLSPRAQRFVLFSWASAEDCKRSSLSFLVASHHKEQDPRNRRCAV